MKLEIPDLAEELSVPSAIKRHSFANLDLKMLLAVALACVTLITYYPVRHNDFIALDDPDYVTENADVQQGFKLKTVAWAFTTFRAANWHPVTWLSHIADCHLFGVDPAAHHLTNLFMHVINAVLLFLLLNRMTGALWRSALVAALFALHPLNVESVAWIAERKNLLSTFFFLLTIWSYITYVRLPSFRNYMVTMTTFALGLMAKPMLVTLPFILLLLDFWPLRRVAFSNRTATASETKTDGATATELLREKVPFFLLSILSSMVTLKAQTPAMASLQLLPLGMRTSHAVVAYATYVAGLFWPVHLAVLYPYTKVLSPLRLGLSLALLFGCSAVCLLKIRRKPYLIVGWLWFVGSLVPVIGIVQVGLQSRADRYVYVPFIGSFVMLSWMLGEGVDAAPRLRKIVAGTSVLGLTLLAIDTHSQLGYWRDNNALFGHALEVTKNNAMAHMIIAGELVQKGDHDGALAHATAALKMEPKNGSIYYTIGRIKLLQGRAEEAENYFRQALQFPNSPQYLGMIHDRIAFLLDRRGNFAQAETEYRKAIQLNPDESYYPRLNLAVVLQREGHFDDAVEQYASLIKDAPTEPSLYFLLGKTREQQRRLPDAVAAFRKTLELQPGYALAQIQLNAIAKEESKARNRHQSRKAAPL